MIHPEISLDMAFARAATRSYQGPFLLLDLDIVRTKARRFFSALPNVRPHFAVKANPHPNVLRVLHEEGVHFEVASPAELDLLSSLGVQSSKVLYSNPVKSRGHIKHAADRGIEWFVLDSLNELEKLFSIKPDAKLYLRIDVTNEGSDWPLAGKFGAHPSEAQAIIERAAQLGADLAGIGFHVGSQCRSPSNWVAGLNHVEALFPQMTQLGLQPRMVNLGGGFPVRLTKPIPSIETIAEAIQPMLQRSPYALLIAEPGRFMVADAGCFVSRVMGVSLRDGRPWLHIDAGVFGGLFEAFEGIRHAIDTDRSGPLISWNVAGPTCDSIDVVFRDIELPADLQEGDFLYIRNAGAYTTAYASTFNGFPLPEVRLV